jgi:hypothetical protein
MTESAGNFQEHMANVPVERPDLEEVLLKDRMTGRTEIRRVRDFLPLVRNNRQEGLFPISGMTATEIANSVPDIELVDNDEEIDVEEEGPVLELNSDGEEMVDGPHPDVADLVVEQHGQGLGVMQVCLYTYQLLYFLAFFLPGICPRPAWQVW